MISLPARMHAYAFLSPKYQAIENSSDNYNLEEAGIAQLDDAGLLKHIDDIGEADNTIVIFYYADGGMTPFKSNKGTVYESGFRVPCIARWPSQIRPGTVENGIFSGLDWLPTLARVLADFDCPTT